MLRVIVELLSGGREAGRRVIATAAIGRVRDGALADYEVELDEGELGRVGDVACIRQYPRWSGSVFDLVVRCIATALNHGSEKLPPRPVPPRVPIHTVGGSPSYVRLREIPEPARRFLSAGLRAPEDR